MKITSASKKVLASALSAAMVVAFAPTVAFGADATGGATLTYVDKAGATKTATYDTVQKAVDEAAKANGTKTVVTLAGNATVDSDLDIAGVADGLTLDLAGNTLSASDEFYKANGNDFAQIIEIAENKDGQATYELAEYTNKNTGFFVKTSEDATVAWKDFSGTPVDNTVYTYTDGYNYKYTETGVADNVGKAGYYQLVLKPGATVATGKVTIKNGTINTIKAEESYAGVKAAAEVILDGVTIEAEAGQKAVDTTANVTVKGDSVISAKGDTTSRVVAINAEDSTVTVEAGKISAENAGTTGSAVNTVRTKAFIGKGGEITASSAMNTADVAAVRVKGDDSTATISAGTYKAVSTTATSGLLVSALYTDTAKTTSAISGGTFEGIVAVKASSIKGGSFSQDMTAEANKGMLAEGYAAKDDGTHSVVYKSTVALAVDSALSSYKTNGIATETVNAFAPSYDSIKAAGLKAATNAADDIFGNMKKTETVAYVFGEGFTADQVKAILSDETKSALVKVAVSYELIDAESKALTDAQKAVVATANEAAAKTMDKAKYAESLSVEMKYRAAGEREYKTLVSITDLGTTSSGRDTVLNAVNMAGASLIENGTATKLEKTKNNGNLGNWAVKTGLYAVTAVDYDAIKDAAGKGEEAVEKATQSIDVAQKSKTVKLAKGKTKTQKAVSFKLGASAETALTIAKKSGSSRISVSGQKITLKKGTKKGTFTAKVSLKAASSDEFLAAAKTITVKFVVKK